MYENKLRKIGINTFMSPQQYLRDFLGIDINDDVNLTESDFHFLGGDRLNHASIYKVNDFTVATGDIILIKFSKGIIKPYYRPNFIKKLSLETINHGAEKITSSVERLSFLINTINESDESEEIFNSMIPSIKYRKRIIDKRSY